MQYQAPGAAPAAALGVGVPLYAPTPLLQPAHPTPFYIEDILGRGPAAAPAPHSLPAPPPPTLPSPNSSFTSLVAPYRTPVYEPTPIHPAFSHHLAATYGTGAYAGPLYSFPRAVGDYTHALIRQDPLGKPRPPPSLLPVPEATSSPNEAQHGSGGAAVTRLLLPTPLGGPASPANSRGCPPCAAQAPTAAQQARREQPLLKQE